MSAVQTVFGEKLPRPEETTKYVGSEGKLGGAGSQLWPVRAVDQSQTSMGCVLTNQRRDNWSRDLGHDRSGN